jgi:putative zinc finger/helix-turn-helix YgiT family protein
MMSKEKAFCEKCDNDVFFDVKVENREAKIRGIKVVYTYYKGVCKKCGEQVFPISLGRKNQISLYDAYKKAVGLLTSEEIISFRKERKLTQIQLAKLMGCGDKTIARYENGAIQDRVFDNFLRLMSDKVVCDYYYLRKGEKFVYSTDCSLKNEKFAKYINELDDLEYKQKPNSSWAFGGTH